MMQSTLKVCLEPCIVVALYNPKQNSRHACTSKIVVSVPSYVSRGKAFCVILEYRSITV